MGVTVRRHLARDSFDPRYWIGFLAHIEGDETLQAQRKETLEEIIRGMRGFVVTIFSRCRQHANSQRTLEIPDAHLIGSGLFGQGDAMWGGATAHISPADPHLSDPILSMIEDAIRENLGVPHAE